MSETTNTPPRILREQLRLGAGFASKERDHVLEILSRWTGTWRTGTLSR